MAKPGRKPWIPSEEELLKVEALAMGGMDEKHIALCLGIRPETLSRKKSELDQLSQALKRGEAKGIAKVTRSLLKNIEKGNIAATIFYLKCKAGWREDKELDEWRKLREMFDKIVKPIIAKGDANAPAKVE